MGCSPWIPRNSSHRPQYDDTGASRHVESNTVEVLWVSAGFVATDFPSGPRPLPTHAQPACFPRPTKNSEDPSKSIAAHSGTMYTPRSTRWMYPRRSEVRSCCLLRSASEICCRFTRPACAWATGYTPSKLMAQVQRIAQALTRVEEQSVDTSAVRLPCGQPTCAKRAELSGEYLKVPMIDEEQLSADSNLR